MTTKRIAASLLAASLAVGVLAGCGTKQTATPTTPTPSSPSTPAPAKAEPQTATFNVGTEPPQMDGARATDSASFTVLQQISEGLARLDKDGKPNPGSGTAASWTVSPDGLTYTFKIKDTKWSDGQAVTSKDFAYSWLRALDPQTASQYNFILFYVKGAEKYASLNIKDADYATKAEAAKKEVGIQTPDDKTLVVTLERPTSYFLGLTAFPTYFPQRKDVVEKFGDKYAADADKMVFNGPFVMKSWNHQNEIILEKNTNYWDAGSVKLTQVTMKMINDSNTAINMFEANQMDLVGIPGTMVPNYQDKAGFIKLTKPRTWYLEWNTSLGKTKPWLANAHIRKAFSLAMDREAFASKVLADGSAPATGLVADGIPLGDAEYRKQAGPTNSVKADAAAAAKELAAGMKELGLDKLPAIEFMASDDDISKKQAQGIQGMIQNALPGVTLNILPQQFKTRLARIRKQDFELVLTGWGADYMDPMTFMDMWTTTSPYNDGKWSNAEYDALIKDAMSQTDLKKRLEDFQKAEKMLGEQLPVDPVFYAAADFMQKGFLKNLVLYRLGPTFDLKFVTIEGRQN